MSRRTLLFVVASIAFGACDGDVARPGTDGGGIDARDASPAVVLPTFGTNAAALVGAPVGTDPPPADARRKVVPVVLGPGSLPGLVASQVTVIAALGETVFWIAPVRWDGPAPGVCNVRATRIELSFPQGPVLGARDDVRLTGSLARAGGAWSADCLGPGETGYLLGITLAPIGIPLYTHLSSMSFDLVAPSAREPLPVRVVPKRYDVDAGGLVTVTVTNEGTTAALLPPDNFTRYVALGPAGEPVDWGFLGDVVDPAGLLLPGATATLGRTMPLFIDGPSSTLVVFVDARDPAAQAPDGGADQR